MEDCELENAFDRVRSQLPGEWFLTDMLQRGDGWHVTCGKYSLSGEIFPRLDSKAGTLTKALNRMAELLEEHNVKAKTA